MWMGGRDRSRRFAVASGLMALLLLPLVLALAGCGSTAHEVDMGVASFQQSSMTINAGQAIHFVDPNSGGTHILCVGQNLHCIPQTGAPAALDTLQGLTFQTGDVRDIVFPTAGTYNVICTIHPDMQVVITVTP
jgi:plastocyanin